MTLVELAKSYIGKTEKPNNSGFNDSVFEKKMEAVGFQKGQAWCSYFAELVFTEHYPTAKKLSQLFNASAVKTFNNFKQAGFPIDSKPFVGALVIWQKQKNGVAQWQGHAGIVIEVIDDLTFRSVEGNTNDDGSRDGYIVAPKKRKVQKVKNGLQVLGFIKI